MGELAGKVVLDTTNYYPQRDGQIRALDEKDSRASELVQEHLPDSFVVKAFNSITFASLGNGAALPGRRSAAPCRSLVTTRVRSSAPPPCSTHSATTRST